MRAVSFRSRLLDERNLQILETVFWFGGYSVAKQIEILTGLSQQKVSDRLRDLCELGFLKREHFFGTNPNQPYLYQVTAGTAKLFGNPHAHARKNHDHDYIMRALLKLQTVIQHPSPYLKSLDEKINHFRDLGVSDDLLPQKVNKGSGTVVFEELLSLAGDTALIVTHIDKPALSVRTQLLTFLERYSSILARRPGSLGFRISAPRGHRPSLYQAALQRLGGVPQHPQPPSLLALLEMLGRGDDKLTLDQIHEYETAGTLDGKSWTELIQQDSSKHERLSIFVIEVDPV